MSTSIYPTLAGSLITVDRTTFYDTTVQRESSGRELRVSRQSAARYRYSISYDFLRQDFSGGDELATLSNFYATHRGGWDSFLYSDPKESTYAGAFLGTGDGTTTVFYARDSSFDRIGAFNGSPAIYKAGALQTITTHYTQDLATGAITFVTAPTAGQALTWDGSFYRRVRFANDSWSTQRRHSRTWKATVELVSVLP